MKNLLGLRKSRLMLLFFLFISTATVTNAQVLPDSWQPGMRLSISYGGGMRQQMDTVVIALGRSYERHQGMDNNTSFSCVFSAKELNQLLQFLKTGNFDKIKSEDRLGIVHDMGSNTILLEWGNNVLGVSSSATQLVPAMFEKDLSDIYAYIDKMMNTKKKQGKPSPKK